MRMLNHGRRAGAVAGVIFSLIAIAAHSDEVKPSDEDKKAKIKFAVQGAANVPVTFKPTNDGNRIKNADNKEIQLPKKTDNQGKAEIEIGAILDGKKVTDCNITFGNANAPLDPGTAYESVFVGGVMTADALATWLIAHGYVDSAAIVVPDFLPVGAESLSYGLDWSVLGGQGEAFVNAHPFGTVFTVDGSGQIPELPMYLFSHAALSYVPGTGWAGVPLAPGSQVMFTGYHTAAGATTPVPVLPGGGVLALIVLLVAAAIWVIRSRTAPRGARGSVGVSK